MPADDKLLKLCIMIAAHTGNGGHRSRRVTIATIQSHYFSSMSDTEDGYKYVLVFKDDHSGYVWLTPTKNTTSETVADILIRWFATFGVINQWVSDSCSHFKNKLVRILMEKTNSSHHFSLAYFPWSNGTV